VVKNPADKDSTRYLRATISEGFSTLVRESKENVSIPAKDKKKVEWKIFPEDAAFERIVLFRLYIQSRYPYPSMSGSCGVVRLGFPWLNGNQLLLLAAGLQTFFLVAGFYMVEIGIKPTTGITSQNTRSRLNGIYCLAILLILSAVFSYFGLWLLGMIGLAASLILAGVTLFRG
jgi:hypothetical protein